MTSAEDESNSASTLMPVSAILTKIIPEGGFMSQENPNQPPYNVPPQGYQMPPGYVQQPPKKKAKWPWFLGGCAILIVLFVGGCAVITGAFVSSTAKVITSDTATTTSSSTSKHFKVGSTVAVDNTWTVTVSSAKTDPVDGQFNIPKSGNTYVLIDVTMKNTSSSQQDSSGLAQFTLRGTDGTNYDEDLSYSKDPGGQVNPGEPIKGTLAYQVPTGTKHFELNFASDIISNQVTWDINV